MHITKNSLLRKVSILSLAVLLFATSLVGSYTSTAHAVGADTVLKLVGGKAVVRALSEKVGMALSKKQVDNVADFIEKKTYDGDTKAIEFVNKANSLTGTASERSGFKKYLLDPAAWLLGLDLIFLAVDAFQIGYDGGTEVPIMSQCLPFGKTPVYYADKPYYQSYVVTDSATGVKDYNIYYYQNPNAYVQASSDGVYLRLYDVVSYSRANYQNGNYTVVASGSTNYHVVFGKVSEVELGAGSFRDAVCSSVPTAQDVVNITNIDNSVVNHFNNDTYNTNTTYNMEFEIPDTVNYDDVTPWNAVDTKIPTEVNPAPVDTDEDGIPDETDSDSDEGKGFLENLIPIITLIAIFDLLKSVLLYLARMFEFILTIPLIEAKPIDNVAFEWFRNAEIVGIEIYSIISLLATIGLSFAVYKVVRRLLP